MGKDRRVHLAPWDSVMQAQVLAYRSRTARMPGERDAPVVVPQPVVPPIMMRSTPPVRAARTVSPERLTPTDAERARRHTHFLDVVTRGLARSERDFQAHLARLRPARRQTAQQAKTRLFPQREWLE